MWFFSDCPDQLKVSIKSRILAVQNLLFLLDPFRKMNSFSRDTCCSLDRSLTYQHPEFSFLCDVTLKCWGRSRWWQCVRPVLLLASDHFLPRLWVFMTVDRWDCKYIMSFIPVINQVRPWTCLCWARWLNFYLWCLWPRSIHIVHETQLLLV